MDNLPNATKLLHYIEQAAQKIGLNINLKKTEYMTFNLNSKVHSLNIHLYV
jgi:hypothetical protein